MDSRAEGVGACAGHGNFIGLLSGRPPRDHLLDGANWTGRRVGILKHLYQDAQIFNPGSRKWFDGNRLDLAISNFLFSDKIVWWRGGKSRPILHDYFFLKSLMPP